MRHRSQPRIVADLIRTAKDMDHDGSGVGVTALLNGCNMPYARLTRLLSRLLESGLLESRKDGKSTKYVISKKGLQYLEFYREFDEFSQSYGLKF